MSVEETEVIVFPIRFEVDPQNIEEVSKAVEDITPGEGEEAAIKEKPPTDELDAETLEALNDFIKTTDKQGLQTLSKFAKNPSGAVEGELLGILGKAGIHGVLAATIIGVIIATPEIIRTIVKALAVKGGPLNQDFHRFFEDEGQIGLARDLQYRRSVGLDVVITSDNRGFILEDPGFVGNNLVDVDQTRSIRTSDKATQYGYVNGM